MGYFTKDEMKRRGRSAGKKVASDTVVFESARMELIKSLNKKGVINPDEDGGFTMIIGALGAHNLNEDFYVYESGVKFFEAQSAFQRKISRGVLRAEYGHPRKYSNMSDPDYLNRLLDIDETRVCGTWVKIWLGKEKIKDDKGRPVVPIYGTIRPSGPYGEYLRKAFITPGEQVCFSIRSFTNNSIDYSTGKMIKRLGNIVTFDYVNEGGMPTAEKLLSPGLESHIDKGVYSEFPIDTAIKVLENNVAHTAALESDNGNVEFINTLKTFKKEASRVQVPNPRNLW